MPLLAYSHKDYCLVEGLQTTTVQQMEIAALWCQNQISKKKKKSTPTDTRCKNIASPP